MGFRVSNRAGRGMNVVLFSAVKRVPASDYILSAAITLKNVCESHDPTPTWWCFYFEDCSGILFPCPGGTGYAGK